MNTDKINEGLALLEKANGTQGGQAWTELGRWTHAHLPALLAAAQRVQELVGALSDSERQRYDASLRAKRVQKQNKALRVIGGQMANLCHNLSQHEHLRERDRLVMKQVQKEWDAALAAREVGSE